MCSLTLPNRGLDLDPGRGTDGSNFGLARRRSLIFFLRKIVPAIAILLLTGAIGWAAPHPPWAGAPGMRQAILWEGGGTWFAARHPQYPPHRREHLPEWFRQHQYLPPWAQERALRNEPGFNRLSPQEQQRLIMRLRQLDAMPPGRRERMLQSMEAMEKLSPSQRQEVRRAMQQVMQLPPDRRWMMHNAYRDLSHMPPRQRWQVLNSPQFQEQFSQWERELLSTLLSVQPYSSQAGPGPGPRPGMGYGRQ